MRRLNELTFVVLCAALIAASTLPGCKGKVKVVEPEPEVVQPEPQPEPPTPEPAPIAKTTPHDFEALVAKANFLESQLEGQVLWEAARKCRDREFNSDTEARDWLKERWRACEKQAAAELQAAEQDAIGWRDDWTLEDWLRNASHVWAEEAQAADPSLRGQSL